LTIPSSVHISRPEEIAFETAAARRTTTTSKNSTKVLFGAHAPSASPPALSHPPSSSCHFIPLIPHMPICITCRLPLSTLYTTYSRADDSSLGKGVRLTQCPRCKRFADKYVEHDFVVLFIDLVLIKPEVYRHLLFNRLGGGGSGEDGGGKTGKEKGARRRWGLGRDWDVSA
jgi:hypothetical protein